MTGQTPPPDPAVPRLIGRARGRASGPTLVCVAGMHGNEPAGVKALRRVFRSLARHGGIRGEVVGLAGNLQALACGERYLDVDLNRQWRPGTLDAVREKRMTEAEGAEVLELDDAIRVVLARRRGPAYFVDLHTTSSPSPPFAVISDSLANRSFARRFPVPIVLGLEEELEGAIADHAQRLGCVTMGFEAGRHDDPASVDLHEALVWTALQTTGICKGPGTGRFVERLRNAGRHLPAFVEIADFHRIESRVAFEMRPGFENFQPVQAGELLARERGEEVRARLDARLFLPLYQGLGDTGFCLVRRVASFWISASTVLRRLRLGAIVHWLPGVRRHPTRPGAVVVHTTIARWFVIEVFHLLGFRRRCREGRQIVFDRRSSTTW
jgi:succinylglutamate desuccinylase